ncbi:unnamed protein product [Amoebophrya sp. A120]|nr:unnamed protein product [Amoebophrya sp. A120]|eukprot:GSA120T00006849001.1
MTKPKTAAQILAKERRSARRSEKIIEKRFKNRFDGINIRCTNVIDSFSCIMFSSSCMHIERQHQWSSYHCS